MTTPMEAVKKESCHCTGDFKMIVGEFFILMLTITGLFFWCRSESRKDSRRIECLVDTIRQDIKDFHGRLCALEEKNKGK